MERARAARVLGVDIAATHDQIRDAYRRRAREVHPDANGADSSAMVELNEAYEVLGSPAEPNWQFVGAPVDEPWETFNTAAFDDWAIDDALDPPAEGRSMLRIFAIALALSAVAVTTVVFVVAIGYDWSLSP